MAAELIKFDKAKEPSRQLVRALQLIRDGMYALEQFRAVAIRSRDGDGNQSLHYDLMAAEGGYVAGDYEDANASAKASFDEADSLYSKVCTNGAVSNVRDAILQACAKHGV